MPPRSLIAGVLLLSLTTTEFVEGFSVASRNRAVPSVARDNVLVRLSETETDESETSPATTMDNPMDAASQLMDEKKRRADELRAQEVFMTRSTGIYKCNTCGWEYDESKGDEFMIGGMIKAGTPFAELPADYRCPRCRASKDNFEADVEEIPGFEVNQGYGLGGNSMTGAQKSNLIFGGLFAFFLLFMSGYALN